MTAFPALMDALETLSPLVRSLLAPGAAPEAFREVTSLLPSPPPEAWTKLYRAANGEQIDYGEGFLFGMRFLPLHDVRAVLEEAQGLIEAGYVDDWDEMEDPRVKQDSPSLALLPIFDDFCGNYLGLDLDPGPRGQYGQVVIFGADYFGAEYVQPDLDSFFIWVEAQVQRGDVTAEPGRYGLPVCFALQYPSRNFPYPVVDPMGWMIRNAPPLAEL